MENSMKKILQYSTVILFINIIVKILGLLKQSLIAYYFGASISLDIYFLSSGFISNIYYFITSILSVSFVVIYLEIKERKNESERKEFVAAVLYGMLILSTGITFLILLFADPISSILAPSYTFTDKHTLAYMLRLFSAFIYFQVLVSYTSSVLNAEKAFIKSAINLLFQNVIIIICLILLFDSSGINSLIYGLYFSYAIQIIYLFFTSKKYLFFKFHHPLTNEHVKKMIKIVIPLSISYGLVQINQLVDRIIVSGLGDGVVSAQTYALTITDAVYRLIIVGVMSVMFTYITEFFSRNQFDQLKKNIKIAANYMMLILFPLSIWFSVYAFQIVAVLFKRGNFTEYAVNQTSYALVGYSIGFVFLGIREVLLRVHYSSKSMRIASLNSFFTVIVNIIGSLILSKYYGILGVAIATSFSSVVSVIIFNYSFRKILGQSFLKTLDQSNIFKILFSSIVLLVISVLFQHFIVSKIIGAIIGGICSVAIYIFLLWVMNVEEVRKSLILVYRKFHDTFFKEKKI